MEQVAEVMQRLVTVHNCCLCILCWHEVWKACRGGTGQRTGPEPLVAVQLLSAERLHVHLRLSQCVYLL